MGSFSAPDVGGWPTIADDGLSQVADFSTDGLDDELPGDTSEEYTYYDHQSPENDDSGTSSAASNNSADSTSVGSDGDSGNFGSSLASALPSSEIQADHIGRPLSDFDGTDNESPGDSSSEAITQSGPATSNPSTQVAGSYGSRSGSTPVSGMPAQSPANSLESTSPDSNALNSDSMSALGYTLDADGRPLGPKSEAAATEHPAWFDSIEGPITVKYDFRDQGGYENLITDQQREQALAALDAWSQATGGKFVFVQDTNADSSEILNIGTGDLKAFGHVSGEGGVLGVGGGAVTFQEPPDESNSESGAQESSPIVAGVAWLDKDEVWDTTSGNGDPAGTVDFFTVASHETGHALGAEHSDHLPGLDAMHSFYAGEMDDSYVAAAYEATSFYASAPDDSGEYSPYHVDTMLLAANQLTVAEVDQLLRRATAATSTQDAIIAIVDRRGEILGVWVEAGVAPAIIADPASLAFAIDGAVAKARTAAFFSNGDPDNGTLAPLTSRTVRFLSQTTITQREVQSNPNIGIGNATLRGPGFVAPIGLGGHFPPDIMHTPPVDLFAIEHTNRDRDGTMNTPRFNIPDGMIAAGLADALFEPASYGESSGLTGAAGARSRGIGTLPGGIPIFKDLTGANGMPDGVGESLVGGIGVFFPGPNGHADFEQGFVPGIGQTTLDRLNAPKVLEAEYIAYAALGGSFLAGLSGVRGAQIDNLGGVARVPGIDIPFGRLDLVGITLEVIGPIANRAGVSQLIANGNTLGTGLVSGFNAPVNVGGDGVIGGGDDTIFMAGTHVPNGWIVPPTTGNGVTAAEVNQIINQAVEAARAVRAAIRLPLSSRTRMVISVADLDGQIVGLFRMLDSTIFSIDVAVAKARNVTYYANPAQFQGTDQVSEIPVGTALTNRTFRFLAEPRFPSGVDGDPAGPFSILNNGSIDPRTAENIGLPAADTTFDPAVDPVNGSVLGFNSFNPTTNFHATAGGVAPANQNGIVFFPGSTPLYRSDGTLIGGLGVSGDGVDQDDVVTFIGAQGFLPPQNVVLRADQVGVRGVRLPYQKFLRNPFG